jgi:hypothetical protein
MVAVRPGIAPMNTPNSADAKMAISVVGSRSCCRT